MISQFCDAPIEVDSSTDSFTVQPSFYYIGHVSRYFVPGSVRIGLNVALSLNKVHSAPLSQNGDSVFLWQCDGGPRQRWQSNFILQNSTFMCMDIVDKSRSIYAPLQVWTCSGTGGTIPGPNQEFSYNPVTHMVHSSYSGFCLGRNDSQIANGVPTVMKPCDVRDETVLWDLDAFSGALSVHSSKGFCLTATGPQVTATAVLAPDNSIAVACQNMLDDTVVLKLQDGDQAVRVTLPPHSIQTLVYLAK